MTLQWSIWCWHYVQTFSCRSLLSVFVSLKGVKCCSQARENRRFQMMCFPLWRFLFFKKCHWRSGLESSITIQFSTAWRTGQKQEHIVQPSSLSITTVWRRKAFKCAVTAYCAARYLFLHPSPLFFFFCLSSELMPVVLYLMDEKGSWKGEADGENISLTSISRCAPASCPATTGRKTRIKTDSHLNLFFTIKLCTETLSQMDFLPLLHPPTSLRPHRLIYFRNCCDPVPDDKPICSDSCVHISWTVVVFCSNVLCSFFSVKQKLST